MRTPVVCVAALALVGSACSDTNGEGSDPTDSSTTAATPTARSDDTVDSVIEVDVTSEAPPDPAVAALRDARLANDGEVPLGLALELFASAYGDLAGVDPRFEGSTAIHNSLAIRRVGAHWSELDDELRSAIEDYLTEPVAPGFRAPSTAGVDPATVNGIVAEFERHLGPLNAEIEVIPSNAAAFRRGERLADAAPIRGGRPVFAGQFDTCQVRFPAGTPPTTMTLAHEIMHCFQFEMAPLDVVFDAPDWYVEGSAEWAGATVGGSDSTLLDHYDAWQTTTESLTALDYEAVGFFWTVETMGADPWDEVPFVLSSELRGPAAFPVLMSQSELVRRMTTGSLRPKCFRSPSTRSGISPLRQCRQRAQ